MGCLLPDGGQGSRAKCAGVGAQALGPRGDKRPGKPLRFVPVVDLIARCRAFAFAVDLAGLW